MAQSRKDSSSKRVNFDNERVSDFDKKYELKSSKTDSKSPMKSAKARKFIKKKNKFTSSRPKDNTFDNKLFKSGRTNHISWYSKNQLLLDNAASFSTQIPTGAVDGYHRQAPGVMALTWNPSYGGSEISVLNNVMNDYYSYVVHKNSRNYNYTPQDLMILTMAVMEPYVAIAEMKRAYGIMRRFEATAEYTPATLLQALGFNYQDLKDNYQYMCDDINLLIAECKQFTIPNNFPVLDRWLWLAENVFIDAESPKAQYYVFAREQYFTYDQKIIDTGGCLIDYNSRKLTMADTVNNAQGKTSNWGPGVSENKYRTAPTAKSWKSWVNMVNNMIQRLNYSQDRGMICGDILKAFDPSYIYSMPDLDPSYQLEFIYDEEALMSIHNATICVSGLMGLFQDQSSGRLTPGYGIYKWLQDAPTFTKQLRAPLGSTGADVFEWTTTSVQDAHHQAWLLAGVDKPLINFSTPNQPTPEQITKATRFTQAGFTIQEVMGVGVTNPLSENASIDKNAQTASSNKPYQAVTFLPRSTGSEAIQACFIAQIPTVINTELTGTSGYGMDHDNWIRVRQLLPTNDATADTLRDLMAFDWAPIIYQRIKVGGGTADVDTAPILGRNISEFKPCLDYNNYTVVDSTPLYVLNKVCMYSLWNMPYNL